MVTVGGKEMLYSTSFTIGSGEEVTLAPAQLLGAQLRIIGTQVVGAPRNEHLKIEGGGREAVLHIPFTEALSYSTGFDMGASGPGRVTGRIVGQGVPGAMVVHLDLYIERTPNYGQR